MSIEAMKQALETFKKIASVKWQDGLKGLDKPTDFAERSSAIFALSSAKAYSLEATKALEEAIADAEKQEPVAWRAPNWGHSADEYVYRDFDDPVIGIDGKPSSNNEPLYTHPQPKRDPLTEWKPIETAPKDTEVLLYCNKFIPLYIGKKRYGCFGEPQQNEFEWRCSSSGRFANPTHWMPLPKSPIEAAHGIKENT